MPACGQKLRLPVKGYFIFEARSSLNTRSDPKHRASSHQVEKREKKSGQDALIPCLVNVGPYRNLPE